MPTINELFDALMGELEGLDTGGAREIVREIRKRVLTPEAVDGLGLRVCAGIAHDITIHYGKSLDFGRDCARTVAAHLCVVRSDVEAARPALGQIVSEVSKLYGIPDTSAAHLAVPQPFGNSEELDPRPIISDASQATPDQCVAAYRAHCGFDAKSCDATEAGLGRTIFAAALAAVRLDASPRPVLDAAECEEIIAFLESEKDERLGRSAGRSWATDEIPWDTIEKMFKHHAIAAEAAMLWGLPAPEPETPKVRRLTDEHASSLAAMAAGLSLKSSTLSYEDGHAIAAYACAILGLEYPK